MLHGLDEAGLADDTLVVLTTDHGLPFPGAKGTLSDRGLGVMLIIRGPGGFYGGHVTDALTSNVDIYPTLLELAGQRSLRHMHGRSLLPLVRKRTTAVRDELFAELTYHAAYDPQRAIRTDRHKLIRHFGDRLEPGFQRRRLAVEVLAGRGRMGEQSRRCASLRPDHGPGRDTRNLADVPKLAGVRDQLDHRLEDDGRPRNPTHCSTGRCRYPTERSSTIPPGSRRPSRSSAPSTERRRLHAPDPSIPELLAPEQTGNATAKFSSQIEKAQNPDTLTPAILIEVVGIDLRWERNEYIETKGQALAVLAVAFATMAMPAVAGATTLFGSGSSAEQPIMNALFRAYNKLHRKILFNYLPDGGNAGVEDVQAGRRPFSINTRPPHPSDSGTTYFKLWLDGLCIAVNPANS